MPFFAVVFEFVFAWLVKFFADKFIGYGVWAAYLVGLVVMWGTMFLAVKSVTSGLYYAIPNEWLKVGFWILWPPQADLAWSGYWSALIAIRIYKLQSFAAAGFAGGASKNM